jgi:hypothetical protein
MQDLLIQAQSLQNLLISRATGGITSANERESQCTIFVAKAIIYLKQRV